jgi:hypothetical protein
LGFALVARLPAPAATAAALCRVGARRRASRQMKNEIPASTANAPSAIPIAVELLSPLEPDVGVVETTGGAVVVVGIWEGEIGTPGENGFPC